MQFGLRIARFFYRFRQTEAFRNLSLIPAAHRDTLKLNNLQIVRHEYASLEIDCGFCRICGFAFGESAVFGVVKKKIAHIALSCYRAGLKGSAVMFLIWLEHITVTIQAECLAHQQVRTADMTAVTLIIWLVTKADQCLSAWKRCTESELLLFFGHDVKACQPDVPYGNLLPVRHLTEKYKFTERLELLRGKRKPAYPVKGIQDLPVSIDIQLPLVFYAFHGLGNHAHNPYRPEYMVRMDMSEIYVMNFIKPCPGLFQAGQYPVAASSVNQKRRFACLQHKAGIIAPRNCGIARSEHYYLAFTFHLIHFRQTPQATRGPDIKNCPPPRKGPRTTCF